MIKYERKILKTILKLTDEISDVIYYFPQSCQFRLVKSDKSIKSPVKYSAVDMRAVLSSLESREYVNVLDYADEILFQITFQGKHHLEYSFDRFREIFFSKFIAGVITGVATTLLAQCLLNLVHP